MKFNKKRALALFTAVTMVMALFAALPAVSADGEIIKHVVFKAGEVNDYTFGAGFSGWFDTILNPSPWQSYSSGGVAGNIALNRGTEGMMYATSAELLRFDLRCLQETDVYNKITGATLTFIVDTGSTNLGGGGIDLYRIIDENGDWASDETDTWAHKPANPTTNSKVRGSGDGDNTDPEYLEGSVAWVGGRLLSETGAPGAGYADTPTASATYSNDDTSVSFDIPKADVLEWINGRNGASEEYANNGLFMRLTDMVVSETAEYIGISFYSSNVANAAQRPTLTVHYTDEASDEVIYNDISFTNQYGSPATNLLTSHETVTASSKVSNTTSEAKNLFFILAMYNGDSLKSVKIETPTVNSGEENFPVTVTLDVAEAGIEDGDYLKAMMWEVDDMLKPVITPAAELTRKTASATYATGNLEAPGHNPNGAFDGKVNVIDEDRWSYLQFDGNSSNNMAFLPTLLVKGANEGWWYGGGQRIITGWQSKSEGNQGLIYNYTIGEETAGYDLHITGTLADDNQGYADNTKVKIVKTDDTDAGSILADLKTNVVYYEGGVGEPIDVYISAADAVLGNDIMFILDYGDWGTEVYCKLNTTITRLDTTNTPAAVRPYVASTNNRLDYPVDNTAGAGKWSLYRRNGWTEPDSGVQGWTIWSTGLRIPGWNYADEPIGWAYNPGDEEVITHSSEDLLWPQFGGTWNEAPPVAHWGTVSGLTWNNALSTHATLGFASDGDNYVTPEGKIKLRGDWNGNAFNEIAMAYTLDSTFASADEVEVTVSVTGINFESWSFRIVGLITDDTSNNTVGGEGSNAHVFYNANHRNAESNSGQCSFTQTIPGSYIAEGNDIVVILAQQGDQSWGAVYSTNVTIQAINN